MIHYASKSFWEKYDLLPRSVREVADKNFEILKFNPKHPSLHLKKIDKKYRSIHIGIKYRALAIEVDDGLLWFWIGSHNDYNKLI